MNTNKAPDKVYLVKDAATPEGVFDTVASKNPMFQDDICYIRKDVLLEWAKEKASDYKGTANIRRSFEMMIQKIESL